jgi:hypothetical protein
MDGVHSNARATVRNRPGGAPRPLLPEMTDD